MLTWKQVLSDIEQEVVMDPKGAANAGVAVALLHVAIAIHRLADTQEKPKITGSKGKVSFSVADYENQPDTQTQELRKLRHEEQG